MQIPRGGFQALVPQQRLNDKQIGTVFEQMRGEGVAQGMGMHRLDDTGSSRGLAAGQKNGLL